MMMITNYSNNCTQNTNASSLQYDSLDVIAEAINSNSTIICDELHVFITEEERIYVQVRSTNAIAFTFIACALLLFFYSCCWFNRFHLCENRDSVRRSVTIRSAALAAAALIGDRTLRSSSWATSTGSRLTVTSTTTTPGNDDFCSSSTSDAVAWLTQMDSLEVLKHEVMQASMAETTIAPVLAPHPELVRNYTLLLNKLEKLAALSESTHDQIQQQQQQFPVATVVHSGISENEYSRVISDIWIGVVLTLLILSTIFFICSCFLYHKFQKWRHTYQTHSPDLPPEMLRHNTDMDIESLPSYTICSGLPTYDDALDQFRKYGIILQPPSVIKIFEENKDKDKSKATDNTTTTPSGANENDDNISMTSTCTCGANNPMPSQYGTIVPINNQNLAMAVPNVIELNPDQLQMLSQKRLSIQIALNNGAGLNAGSLNSSPYNSLNNSIRKSSRQNSRVNLFREVSRNNLLRTHEIPSIHRSASQQSLYQDQLLAQRFKTGSHRGSLC